MSKFFNNLFENKKLFWSFFGIIILFGLGLRLTLINFPLWYDEGCSVAGAINSFPLGINDYLWNHDIQHTPFYLYILHFIMQFFGDSTVVLRVSSLIVSMALLPLTYIVAEKLSSKKVALLAMLFMSVNTFQVLYSIEIRMYPYVILLALLSVNYLIDYDRKGDIASLVKLGVVNILNPYFLTGSIVFVIAEIIIYSIYLDSKNAPEEKVSKYIYSNLIMSLFFIPYLVLIIHYGMVRQTFLVTDISSFSANNFFGMFQNLVSCDPGHIHETRFEPFKSDINTILLVFLPIIAIFWGVLKSITDKEGLNRVILGIITLCFIIFVFLANSRTIAFTGRYIIFITPFVFILSAIGLSKYNKYFVLTLTLLYTVGCCWGLHSRYDYYKNIAEYSLKSPADFCKEYKGKDNLVIMPFASSVSFYYFKGDDMPTVLPLELFHEVRNPNSNIIYDDSLRDKFKKSDKAIVFQEIITGNKPISNNLVKFLNSYISKVPKGGYIIWVVYYSDNYAIKPPEFVKMYYRDIERVRNSSMTGMLSKFDIDMLNVVLPQATLVRRDRDLSNSFFVFKKR